MINMQLEVKPIPDKPGMQTLILLTNGPKAEIQKLKFDIMAIAARYNREAQEKKNKGGN